MLRVLSILVLLSSFVLAEGIHLTKSQIETARKIYHWTAPYNLGKTVVAIAYIESSLGVFKINLQDPSCGVTAILLKTFISRHNLEDTKLKRNKYCQDLVESDELSVANTLEELIYWKKIRKNRYRDTLASYNGGWNYKNLDSQDYADKVIEIVNSKDFPWHLIIPKKK